MRFVEEEHELWPVGIAHLGQVLEQLREQPQQQRRVDLRRGEQLIGGEDVHDTFATGGLQQICDVQHGLAE